MVDLFEALTHLSPKVQRLLSKADEWKRAQREGVTALEPEPFQPKQTEALAVRLGEGGVTLLRALPKRGDSAGAGQLLRRLQPEHSEAAAAAAEGPSSMPAG